MVSPPERHIRAYRLFSPQHPPLDGSGTHRHGSRWISPGHYVVHAAETYALAVLENLVHWQTNEIPPTLACATLNIPGNLAREIPPRPDLPDGNPNDYGP